jgi:carbon-monoxide dehydrogenase large subunit
MNAPLIGQSIKRKKTSGFLTGAGCTDDVVLPGRPTRFPALAARAREDTRHRHGKGALSAPGVVGVFTGEDLAAAKVGGLPCGWLITDVNGQPMKEPPHPPLAQGKVRYVGDHVAVVVAETLHQARDAAELIAVDYEVLPALVKAGDARNSGARCPRRRAGQHPYVWSLGDKGAGTRRFKRTT